MYKEQRKYIKNGFNSPTFGYTMLPRTKIPSIQQFITLNL